MMRLNLVLGGAGEIPNAVCTRRGPLATSLVFKLHEHSLNQALCTGTEELVLGRQLSGLGLGCMHARSTFWVLQGRGERNVMHSNVRNMKSCEE